MKLIATPDRLTARDHIAGVLLLILSVSTLGLLALLPSRGDAGIQLPFLEDTPAPIVVAFAGFPGCGTVCPRGLSVLDALYDGVHEERAGQLDILFINIQQYTPPAVTSAYASSFNPEFLSYTVTPEDATLVYDSLSLRSFDNEESIVSHSGFVYVFVEESGLWRIEHVYRKIPTPNQLVKDVNKLLQRYAPA